MSLSVLIIGLLHMPWLVALQMQDTLFVIYGSAAVNPGISKDFIFQPDRGLHFLHLQDAHNILIGKLSGLFSSGLLYSGLLPLWWCGHGLMEAGGLIESQTGPWELIMIFIVTSFAAAFLGVWKGISAVILAGPGVVTGLYVAWLTLALTRYRGQIPWGSDTGLVLLLVNLGYGAWQPAVGLWSHLGGAIGGVLGVGLAPRLVWVLDKAIKIPVIAAVWGVKVCWDIGRLVFMVVSLFVLGTVSAVKEAALLVKNL
jgi:hypothetical protein